MKNLLYKEIKLCIPHQVWIFVFLTCLIAIPTWPSLVAFIYPMSGFLSVFPIALANRDLLYTGTLPIDKSEVVLGKVLLLCFLELLCLLVSIPFGLVRNLVLAPMVPAESSYAELGVNMAMYGIVLIGFGIFNLIYFPRYYKSPDTKNVLASLLAYFCALSFYGVCSGVFMGVPGAATFINSYSGPGLWTQLGVLALGIVCFCLFNLCAFKTSKKRFEKIDL